MRPSRAIGAVWHRGRRILLGRIGILLALPFERAARRSDRRVGAALVYHSVADQAGDPRRELVPAVATSLLAAQVRYLASRYRIVEASKLVDAVGARAPGDPIPVAITFDDDLASHAEHAAPILRAANATATFFVSGASLDERFRFWWECLQVAFDRKLDLGPLDLPDRLRTADIHALGRWIQALPASERDRLALRLAGMTSDEAFDGGLHRERLGALASSGVEVGFHTLRHDLLPALSDDELVRAMRDGRAQIEQVVGRPLQTISYPHGAADARVARAARAAGYEAGFTGRPTIVGPTSDPLLLGRLSPSIASVGELAYDVARAVFRTTQR
jgi:peptidoglycan/xylan/chitin deacetylase (PgdA/CDA1 family)